MTRGVTPDRDGVVSGSPTGTALGLSVRAWAALAFTASIWHAFIDAHIGLLGPTSETMTLAQGAALIFDVMLIGWWIYMALEAFSGDERALGALALLLVVEPVLFDGLVAFAVAPPPSAAFPYQDLAHSLSLVSGITALVALRRSLGWGRLGWPSWVALGLKVVSSITGALVFFSSAS